LDIKSRIVGKPPGDFFIYANQYGKDMYKEWSIGNSRRYACVLSKLKVFHKEKKLYFDEINVTLIKKFQRYLSGKLNNKQNTIHANLKVIRRIITEAVSEELITYEKNLFLKIKLRCEKSNRAFLLDDELDKLENLPLTGDSRMQYHRDLYIFSAYSGGIRISDLLLMRWKHFDGTHLNFRIKKTKEDIRIRLPEKSLLILQVYYKLAMKRNRMKKADPHSYIFPLINISPAEQDRIKIHNAISSATSYTIKDLRKLTRLAGIDKKISFHTARHSWAIRALQKGMRIEYVSKILGHASVKQTEVYAKVMNEELDKAMEVFNKNPSVPVIPPSGPIQANLFS
jgi:integrase/recombinase XerD